MAATTNSIFLGESMLCGAWSETAQGSPEFVGALYASHYRYVLQVCKHFFWQQEDAEDAAAEVFLKLHTVLKDEDRPIRFKPWLSKVTGRHCIDKLRQGHSERVRRVVEVEYDALPDHSTPSPLSRVLLREQQRQVREEVRRLPRHYRVPLVLHYYRRMSYTEIARTLGRQLPAVKMAIFRAKRLLRGRLLALGNGQAAQGLVPEEC